MHNEHTIGTHKKNGEWTHAKDWREYGKFTNGKIIIYDIYIEFVFGACI